MNLDDLLKKACVGEEISMYCHGCNKTQNLFFQEREVVLEGINFYLFCTKCNTQRIYYKHNRGEFL